jgi:hypothetical protein
MKRFIFLAAAGLAVCVSVGGHVDGRGFGGFRGFGGGFGGGFHYGGYGGGFRSGGFGGFGEDRFGGFGEDRFGGSYSGYRSFGGYAGYRGGYGLGSYDRNFTTARGGTISTEGTRGFGYGRYGGAAVGGVRDTSITTAGGRTFNEVRAGGAAVGPYGRVIGGGWRSAYAGTRFPTDMGLAHYTTFGATGVAHNTTYWSRTYMGATGAFIRNGFGYYHCFYPGWYRRYPGAWYAAGWAAGAAWTAATWPAVVSYVGLGNAPEYTYDYGSDVVYQNNNVYIGGQDAGTAQQYAQEATNLAVQGQTADAPPTADWKPLGVFALAPNGQQASNNVFQLAIDQNGVIRGNYYDGVLDTTTPVYGSVDKKTQKAAWTIGKTKDRVFEAGLYNLTQPEAPVLVHFGADKTQQWLLVRVEKPENQPAGND